METSVELATTFGRDRSVPLSQSRNFSYSLHRLCPIFFLSNVTGEGLDYVSFPTFDVLKYAHLRVAAHVLESSALE